MLLTIYAIVMLLLWTGISLYLVVMSQKIIYLKDVTPGHTHLPSVAIVVAVKDEEAEVEAALRSVCGLQYPRFRVIVINDRSTDGTAAILQRLAAENPLLDIITVEHLPKGWLGKNHALYQGYRSSSEEWLLFTDADVKFAPGALTKALTYTLQKGLDHLTILPEVTSRSSLFKAVMNTFALMLDVKLRPWAVSDPSSDASMGVGAFNLVRRTAYEKAGTHTVISLRPDDDLKLGERIKKAGLRQDVLFGEKEIWLEWYTSLGQFISGLMKNTFSVSNYNLFMAMGMALTTFLIIVLPVPLLLLAGYPYYLLSMVVYIVVKSALLTIRQGGIYWRDSFYSLAELKKQV